MLEAPNNSRPVNTQIVFGRHCTAWSEEELDLLRPHLQGRVDASHLAALFPHRTKKAVMKQIARLRGIAGIKMNGMPGGPKEAVLPILDAEDPGFDDGEEVDWRRAASVSNAAFLQAIARAGLHA